jgi:hypothetical protein
LDGINLFDPWWRDPDYDAWYRLLTCGLKLPASTGSDWYLCSSNRVYADVGATFSYERWLDAVRGGRTFITDGPVLTMTVEGQTPSTDVLGLAPTTRAAEVTLAWSGTQPVDRIEVIRDGAVAFAHQNVDASLEGSLTVRLDVADAGWVAARCWGQRRTSYGHPLWAHTSPVYLRGASEPSARRAAASALAEQIDGAREWIATRARFDQTGHRDRLLQLYADGRATYERLARG